MFKNRQIAVAVAMFFAILAPAGAAGAQVAGCDFSECPAPGSEAPIEGQRPTGGHVPAEGESPTGGPGGGDTGALGGVAPASSEAASPGGVAAGGEQAVGGAAAAAPSGALPVTGGDLAALVMIGAGAVAVGSVLVRRSRRVDATA